MAQRSRILLQLLSSSPTTSLGPAAQIISGASTNVPTVGSQFVDQFPPVINNADVVAAAMSEGFWQNLKTFSSDLDMPFNIAAESFIFAPTGWFFWFVFLSLYTLLGICSGAILNYYWTRRKLPQYGAGAYVFVALSSVLIWPIFAIALGFRAITRLDLGETETDLEHGIQNHRASADYLSKVPRRQNGHSRHHSHA